MSSLLASAMRIGPNRLANQILVRRIDRQVIDRQPIDRQVIGQQHAAAVAVQPDAADLPRWPALPCFAHLTLMAMAAFRAVKSKTPRPLSKSSTKTATAS
jgi:hypothetical protein